MKALLTTIIATALGACMSLSAQGLSAPDDPAQIPDAPTATADSTATAGPAPLHNTPAESYRAERNYVRQGNYQFADSNWHRALECYDKALLVNAGSLAARYNKAATLLRLATADNAGTQADPRAAAGAILTELIPEARRYRPEIAQMALYNLGNMSYNDGNYDQAIAMYERALMLNPDDIDARYNLRLAQLKRDQNQDQQDQQDQDEEQQQEQQQQQQQQQPEPQPMTQPSQQILQSMQNKENQTRQRVNENEEEPAQRRQPEKPW